MRESVKDIVRDILQDKSAPGSKLRNMTESQLFEKVDEEEYEF